MKKSSSSSFTPLGKCTSSTATAKSKDLARAEAEVDRFSPSLWRFRFWRSVALVFHAAFINFLIRDVDFTGIGVLHPMFIATVTATLLSAVTFVIYYNFVLLVHSSGADGGLGKSRIFALALVILIHTLVAHFFQEDAFFPLLFSLQGISFIAYSRALIRGDESLIIQVFLISYASRASDFYSKNLSACLYFAAVILVGFLALAIDKGFRPVNAGTLDLFLGILGDLESPEPRKEVMINKVEDSGAGSVVDDNQVQMKALKVPKAMRRTKG